MSLIDEIKVKSLSEAQEILKAAGTEDLFEKAHKDGDMHPNGKWVWVSSAAGGKGDWRTLNGRAHKKHQTTMAAGGGSTGNRGNGSAAGNSSTTQPTSGSGNGSKATYGSEKVGDVLNYKDYKRDKNLLKELLKKAKQKDGVNGEKLYHVKIVSYGVNRGAMWLREPEIASHINGYSKSGKFEVTALKN